MPNKVVSQDIDTLLTKATKEDAAEFLGLEDTKAEWGQITGTLTTQTDLTSELNSKQDTLTFGTANTNAVKIDNTSAAANGGDIAIFASTGIMPKTFQSLKSDLGVDDKAPKASPTFTGTATFSGDASFEGSSFTIDASTDASFDGSITVTGDAEFAESILLEGGAEIGDDVKITNGGIELQDGGIEITSDGEIELQGSGGVVLQGSGDVQLQGGGDVTVTNAGKIKVGSDLKVTSDTIEFDDVIVVNVQDRKLIDEDGDEAFVFNDRTKLTFGGDGETDLKVGIRKNNPSQALDVGGTIEAEFLKVTGGFESDNDCRITGELQVEGSGGLKVDDTIEADGDVTITSANKALTKQKCYNKTGAVRLQRGNTDSEEILLRYEGQNSEDFVIQQWHGGNKEGQIKFQGDTPNGSNTVRLDAKQVDIGFTGTVLTKIYSDTNFGANKKFVFTDTRDATDGLQFNHSGAGELVQMGMYGSYGDSNVGEFKITHKDGTASNTDVLSISPTANKVKIHKPLNLGNVPVFANNTAATSLATGDVYRTSTGVLMIKY